MEYLLTILVPLLIHVESDGDNTAIGDNGKARGCLQIHRAYWIDGCEELKVDWDYKAGSFDREKSIAVVKGYMRRYGRRYKRMTGKEPSLEVLARMHNGGLHGWEQQEKYKKLYKNTTVYWGKVKTLYDEQEESK